MILFFDRSVGVVIPQALLHLKLPVRVEFHQKHFLANEPDDRWLPVVGQQGWTVIGHDSRYHLMPNELAAIKQYRIGCFYLWGAEATRWERMQVFARAYDRIVKLGSETPAPFIYRVDRKGLLRAVRLT